MWQGKLVARTTTEGGPAPTYDSSRSPAVAAAPTKQTAPTSIPVGGPGGPVAPTPLVHLTIN